MKPLHRRPVNLRLLFCATIMAGWATMLPAQTSTVCPTVSGNTNTDCAFILTIGTGGKATIAPVRGASPYDSQTQNGSLIGVVNNSGAAFSGTFSLQGTFFNGDFTDGIFDLFSNDGICSFITATYCQGAATGYEGPAVTFSNILTITKCSDCNDSGTINISNLAAGGTTYFALNGSPAQITAGNGINIIGGGTVSAPVCPIIPGATNTDCGYIITIGKGGAASIAPVANATPYDVNQTNGSLVGIVNNSGNVFTGSLALQGSFKFGATTNAFNVGVFDFFQAGTIGGDGICGYAFSGYCFSASTGFEGPLVTFSNITPSGECSPCATSGTVNITNLPANGSTYFSLQGAPAAINANGGLTIVQGSAQGSSSICPSVTGANTDCAFLITLAPGGANTINARAGATGFSAGSSISQVADVLAPASVSSLVGVVNNSGAPFTGSFTLIGKAPVSGGVTFITYDGIFDFNDQFGGGICTLVGAPYCPMPLAYEGPLVVFSNVTSSDPTVSHDTGVVSINGLPAGSATYFSIHGDPSGIAAGGGLNFPVSTSPPLTLGVSGVPASIPLGNSISATFTASGGNPPYSYSAAGVLPPGLTFNGNTVSGIPSQPGFYTISVKVTDSQPVSTVASVSFSVVSTPPPTTYPSLTLGVSAVPASIPLGNSISATFTASGGNPPYSYSAAGSLPPGLALNGNTVSGIPSQPGAYTISVKVTDSQPISTVASVSFSVVSPPPPTTYPSLTLGVSSVPASIPLGNSISATFTASGGNPPYSYSAAADLPAGFGLNGNTVSGIPSQPGAYTISVKVTDSQPVSTVASASFSVLGFATGPVLPGAVQFAPYFQTVIAAGGIPPYTFSGSGGPEGISVSSAGVINGTATAPGTYSVTITVTDSRSVSYSSGFSLVVTAPAPLNVPTSTLESGNIGTPYTQTLSATGGIGPYTWRLASGSLPDGLRLNTYGTISGIPRATGSFSFNATATDSKGASATGTVTSTILPPVLNIGVSSPLTSGMVNISYPTQLVAVSGGVPPYKFAVTSGTLPAGLTLNSDGSIAGTPTAPGTASFTLTATDSATPGASAAADLQASVRPFSTDLILSAGSLAFTTITGSTLAPPAETVQVQSSVVGAVITYTTAITPAVSWLSVAPAGGSTPGAITISLTPQAQSLAPANTPYQATVVVTCVTPSACAGKSQTVKVTLTATSPPPQLSVVESLLTFTTLGSSPQATTQTLDLQNIGGGNAGIASITTDSPWIRIGSFPPYLSSGAVAPVNITADPAGLTLGYYWSTITVTSSTGVITVPVSLFIASNSSMALQPAGQLFEISAGGTVQSDDNSFLINVSSASAVNWTARVVSGGNWLKLVTTSGTATSSQPGTVNFSIDQSATTALNAQAYYGTIRVASNQVVNSPLDFQVVLNISPATTLSKPSPAPAGLLFITTASSTPPPQTVTLGANASTDAAYQASVSTTDGHPWLIVNPTVGTAGAFTPAHPQISVNPAGLAPGIYYGGVSYAFSSAAVRTVNVELIVQPPSAAATGGGRQPAPASATPQAGSCAPAKLAPVQVGLLNNFSAPASWPTPLAVQLLDDCGATVSNGQIVATFSNGDPPLALTLANSSSALYSGTWTPRRSTSQVTINATATAAGFSSTTTQLVGAVTPNSAPVLAPNGTLHIFNPQVGGALGPGTIVQIYGTNLASQAQTPSSVPLPDTLGSTSVIIGGIQVPLYFVSPGQINAQLPFELSAGQQYQVIVSANGALTTPQPVQLAPVAPGLAALPGGAAIAQHNDGSLVTETSPAKPGEFLVMYTAGMGATDTTVATGVASPSNPLARPVAAPQVTINSEPATIFFAGLTPGLVGLYQVNFQVPTDAPNGDLPLVLSQAGQPANATILPVHN